MIETKNKQIYKQTNTHPHSQKPSPTFFDPPQTTPKSSEEKVIFEEKKISPIGATKNKKQK